MIFIITGVVIGVAYGLYADWSIRNGVLWRFIFGALVGLFGGLSGGLIMFFMTGLAMCCNWNMLGTTAATETHELVQISDSTYGNIAGDVGGGMFLIRGGFGTNLAAGFSYYQKEDDGFSLKTVEASNTTIKYTDDTPRIETMRTYCPDWENGPSFDLLWSNACPVGSGVSQNVIYVPNGSIIESFKLGGEK